MKTRARLLGVGVAVLGAACGGEIAVVDAGLGRDAGPVATTDSGPDAAAFDVRKVPGLVLWLDATKGVTVDGSGNVSQWADQSGNANDAAQTSGALRPSLVPSGIDGKAVIRFNAPVISAPNLTIADAATLRLGTGDFYVTTVAKRTANNPALGCVLSKQEVLSPYAGYAIYLNLSASHAGGQLDANHDVLSANGPYGDSVARQFGFVRTSGTVTFRVNGVVEGTLPGTAVTADALGVPLSIGGVAPNGLHGLVGDVAEIVLVKGTISSSDTAAIESYLKTKYAL